MPIEIDLGERFGKIVIERKKTIRGLLSDLVKDRKAIAEAVKKCDSIGLVDRREIVAGDEVVSSPRILIASFKESPYAAQMMGYRSVVHSLYVDVDGRLIEDTRCSPNYRFGNIVIGGETTFLDLKYLPDWISRALTPETLKAEMGSLFYLKK